jgi:hypothetical protein
MSFLAYDTKPLPLRTKPFLPSTLYEGRLSVHHVDRRSCPQAIIKILHLAFQAELDRGRSFSQEGEMSQADFEGYFFGADVFVGILHDGPLATVIPRNLEDARAGRDWTDCLVGAYYVCLR